MSEILTETKKERKSKVKETPKKIGEVRTESTTDDKPIEPSRGDDRGLQKSTFVSVDDDDVISKGEEEVKDDESKAPDAPEAPATGMRKNPLNIAPDADDEQFAIVEESLKLRGYDSNFPIVVSWDGTWTGKSKNYHLVDDGWTRWQACQKLGITPIFKHYDGTDKQILNLCINSNSRKIYTKDQWACICVDYKKANADILAKEAKEKMLEGNSKGGKSKSTHKNGETSKGVEIDESKSGHKNVQTKNDGENGESKDGHKNVQAKKRGKRTNEIVIEDLGADTNRNKIDEAEKLDKENPEAFKAVKNKKKTLKQAKAEADKAKAEAEKNASEPSSPTGGIPDQSKEDSSTSESETGAEPKTTTDKAIIRLINKVIKLQVEKEDFKEQKKIIESEIISAGGVGKDVKLDAEFTRINGEISSRKYDIHTLVFEIGHWRTFKTKYNKATMSEFDEMATL